MFCSPYCCSIRMLFISRTPTGHTYWTSIIVLVFMQGGKGDGKRKTWLLASRRWEFIKLGSVWDILLPHPDPLSALLCPALCLKSCPVWPTPVFSLVLWPRSMRRLEEGRRVRSEYLFPQPPPCSSTGGRWNSRSHLWVLDLATSSHPQPLST